MFKLRYGFARAKRTPTGYPQRLLDEGRINDLLLVIFGILSISLITFPTQRLGVEATGQPRFVFSV